MLNKRGELETAKFGTMLWKGDQSPRVKKGNKACVDRKVGQCFQWRAHGQCSKGDSCSFSHDTLASGNGDCGQRRKGRLSSPAFHPKEKTGGEEPESFHKNQAIKRKARQIKEARFDPDTSFVNMRRVSFGILPCVRTASLKKVVDMVTNAISDTVGQKRRPTKRSKKGAAKRSVAILKESIQLGCVSQDSYPRKSILRESGKLGSKHTVKFSKDTWHQIKYPGKQGSRRRAMHMMSENEKKKNSLDDTPAVLSLGKLCEDHGYSYEWTSGEKPRLTKGGQSIICKADNFVLSYRTGVIHELIPKEFRLPHRHHRNRRDEKQKEKRETVSYFEYLQFIFKFSIRAM